MEKDPTFSSRLKHAWNAFFNRAPTENEYTYSNVGPVYYTRPDRPRFSKGNEKSIVTSVYNRIALDCASINIVHCKLDDNDRYLETINSGLNDCLNLEANIDQTSKAFIQDVVMSLFDEGCIAVLPVDTTDNPKETQSYDINTMRVAQIIDWYPRHVKLKAYDDRSGEYKELLVPKNMVAIIENPFYAIMNESNSTLKRLIRKLNILDAIDEQSGSGKLDLIIQLPFTIKTSAKRNQAEQRRKDIEQQLSGSKYGIAYADAAERITQLNRPVENNLLSQIKFLSDMLWSQLNITQAIMDGSASDSEMINYFNRTIEVVVSAIADEFKRKFLTKTARTQKQSIKYFRDPFKLVPVSQMAEISDKMTRNEIMSSNEVRQSIGLKPSSDPKADELLNKNINHPSENEEDKNTGKEKANEIIKEGENSK